MSRFICIIACLLILISCVSVNAVRLGPAQNRPPVPADQVVVYRTADQVPGDYEEIALLNAEGSTTWTNEANMIEAMKNKAGQYGANGIILDAISEPSSGAKVAGAFLGVSVDRKGKAVAIYVHAKE